MLRLYHEYDFVGEEQVKEDMLQDKIVIYNEVIDTMRAIMNIFKYKKMRLEQKEKEEAAPQRKNSLNNKDAHLKMISNKFDLMEEL